MPHYKFIYERMFKMSTMKEVYEKIKTLATQSLKVLEDAYEFHTTSEVTWVDPYFSHIDKVLQREIDYRKDLLSEKYEKTLLEFEKVMKEEFKDICGDIEYSLCYDTLCGPPRTSLTWITININGFNTGITYRNLNPNTDILILVIHIYSLYKMDMKKL